MKSDKILIIAIIIILVLVITGTVIGYLYLKTDTFKSDKELFSKYIYQNIEDIQKFKDSQIIKKYEELNSEEKYESDTKIKAVYSEGGEVSNPINNLSATVNIQKDDSEKYFYADGQVLVGEQKYLESEIIKNQELYGIRFTDVVKQFITVKNDRNLDAVASDIGTDGITLEKLMNVIDGTSNINNVVISSDDKKALEEKYFNIIKEAISEGKFGSNKKAMITYNNNTINTKAYTVTLTNEQVEKLLIEILNQLKTEESIINNLGTYQEQYQSLIDKQINSFTEEKEVPDIKITVYGQKEKTIRTVFEIGTNKIVLENSEENGEIKTNIKFSVISSDNTNEYNIELVKNSTENGENLNLTTDVTNGDDKYTISCLNEMETGESKVQIKSSVNYKKDILTASLVMESNVTIGDDFNKKQELADNNNFVLNNADENVRKNIITQLKQKVPEKFESRLGLLKDALGLSKTETDDKDIPEIEMTQIDINKFNAKFEFFTGDEVSSENVKKLIDVVKDNLGSYEIKQLDTEENTNTNNDPSKIKYSFRLNIERNKQNQDGANQILEKIFEKKKYKVSIFYKEQNKLIDYITIEDVTQ